MVFHENFQVSFKVLSRKFQRCFKDISKKQKECFEEVSRVFPESSKVLKSFKYVSKEFQE